MQERLTSPWGQGFAWIFRSGAELSKERYRRSPHLRVVIMQRESDEQFAPFIAEYLSEIDIVAIPDHGVRQ